MKIGADSFKEISNINTNIKLIKDVREYLEFVEYLKQDFDTDYLWFRGVSHAKYKLIPGICRTSIGRAFDEKTTWIFDEFARKAKPFVKEHQIVTKWELYFLMQHYGMPTRFLDWTEGSLIALYFAVRNLENIHIPSVYVIDPFGFDQVARKTSKKETSIFGVDKYFLSEKDNEILECYLDFGLNLPNYPLFIEPPETDPRIVAQRGVFTVHGKKIKGFNEICKNNESTPLAQLRLATNSADYIKDDLNTMGINEFTLFPDLEGLSRYLKWDWGID